MVIRASQNLFLHAGGLQMEQIQPIQPRFYDCHLYFQSKIPPETEVRIPVTEKCSLVTEHVPELNKSIP